MLMPLGIGLAAAQAGANYLIGQSNRRNALEDQKKMGKYNLGLELEKFEKTGYDAQVRQMDKAGLSKSLMYSGGSGGGVSGSSVTQGGGPQDGGKVPLSPIDVSGIELQKAQTEKIKAETDGLKGIGDDGSSGSLTRQKFEELLIGNQILDKERRVALETQEVEIKAKNKAALLADSQLKINEAQADKVIAEIGKIANDVVRDNKMVKYANTNTNTNRMALENKITAVLEQRKTAVYTALINQGGGLLRDLIKGGLIDAILKGTKFSKKSGGSMIDPRTSINKKY